MNSLNTCRHCEPPSGGAGDWMKETRFPPLFARQRRLAYWWDRRLCLSKSELSQERSMAISWFERASLRSPRRFAPRDDVIL
ncbi:MAG TPA: hypothetical protein PLQ35_14135 [bacterium]|nr:hypothetical protein [bacterium]HQL63425.1 hypothetical protein [bacterium]